MNKHADTLLKRIATDPEVCHGAPCVRATRVHIDIILDALAAGETEEQILEDYPRLDRKDIAASLAYAARAFQPA